MCSIVTTVIVQWFYMQIRTCINICMRSYSIVVHAVHCVLVVISRINHKSLLGCHILVTRMGFFLILMATFGKIDKFDAKKEEWAQYEEHLTQFFLANSIENAEEKAVLFLLLVL